MTGRRRPRPVVWLLSCAAVALGGCGSVSTHAQDRSLRALATTKPPVGPDLKLGKPTKSCEQHPYRSLEPSTLPRPGRMPPRTFVREIQDHGRLIVGVDQNSLGLGYFNPSTSQMEGFDIDLVREVARAIFGDPRRIRYVAISTGQRQSAIHDESVHIVASAFSIACDRRTRMLFSSQYHVAKQRLLVPQNSKVTRLEDLRGQRVCATKASTTMKLLERRRRSTGILPYPVLLRTDCLVALQEGSVAAISSDDAILLGFQRQDPETRIVGPALAHEHYGMAINKARPGFVRFVNAVLRRLRGSGCFAAIKQHWLERRVIPAPSDRYARCTRR